ncbi:nucleotide exchange factor GrpE [Paraconexibacter antarcticus]|uniref:Protein GrpE n=1 Tax=Paraconexibacter antarcticus TaxID=2949664 RepID=A0ABY5DV64_9ACTN|nr:nucleotide exchange factor GrpE [Paraconexibacter antarcticus]UTI64814.1 nucleotide exchange factor GrpE [Paraconexibacter antarcticus]
MSAEDTTPGGEPALDAELVTEEAAEAAAEATAGDGSTGALMDDGTEAGAEAPAAAAGDAEPAAAPDYQDLYLRSAAEMDNLRKRARRDVGAAEGRGVAKLAKELLPALDNLDRALAAAEAAEGDEEHTITRGIRLVQSELAAALTRVGITTEIPLGAPFDPHRHEALTQHPKENTAPGLVIDVYQPGYVYGDTVLRAAKVVVSA